MLKPSYIIALVIDSEDSLGHGHYRHDSALKLSSLSPIYSVNNVASFVVFDALLQEHRSLYLMVE